MKCLTIVTLFGFSLALASMPVAEEGWVADTDFVTHTPLGTNSSLSGLMFTRDTEILTPQGILDEPDAFSLQHIMPAAGPNLVPQTVVSPSQP